ncbi:3-oxo-tetronate kinase [Diaminobutyricimonas sp. TR449]|uniref:3-oxo-tetronate kinase n=1 Tax=Diaminobutyricimonas sp. TR449 TaxID=2708076 RepID=UPI0014236DE9|nr:3-oxo-tetronate kinase [Diaminobutyricimonas sp. TR449]
MIGVIADDFTGATDVAVAFRRAGLRVLIFFGIPADDLELTAADAIVVALKSRTIAPDEAVRQSLEAAAWLQARGMSQLFFKYCSTFDSTPRGNIGPVADALADLMASPVTTVIPSSPGHDRRQYMGQLFVGQQLLSESPMRNHPLTPMTDAYIPRVLEAQTARPVALLDHRTVLQGAEAISERLAASALDGQQYLVVDAVTEADLTAIGAAIVDAPLITGAAGIARGLGAAKAQRGGIIGTPGEDVDPVGATRSVVLAGSCSARTLEQIDQWQRRHPSYRLDALATPDPQALAEAALAWFDAQPAGQAALIYSSLPPAELRATQEALGVERASTILETAMALIAQELVERDIRRIVVAGGETSGAVVSALGVGGGVVGREAAPGVPWIYTASEPQRALLLKSGNFGDPELLLRAVEIEPLEGTLV